MKKEMLINVLQPEECRIAIVEDGTLGLEHVDQHFFLHAEIFLTLSRLAMVG